MASKVVIMFVLIWGTPDGKYVYNSGPYETQKECFMAGLVIPRHFKVWRCKRVEIIKD